MANDEDENLEFNEEGESDDSGSTSVNYITKSGIKKLQSEYNQLFHEERPKLVEVIAWAASNGDRSENGDYIYGKRRLREIDRRLRFLGRRLAAANVVEMANQPNDKVLFGAIVTIENEDGQKFTYRIVGEDEIDIENRKISWVSPVAKALIGHKLGDSVVVHRPSGETEFEIINIKYPED